MDVAFGCVDFMVKQIKTGIFGLDSVLFGGIPEHNQVVVAGGPGAGKSLLSFEFLYRSALEGEIGIMFSLDEEVDKLLENVKEVFVGMEKIDEFIKEGKITVIGEGLSDSVRQVGGDTTYQFGKVVADIEAYVKKTGATRVVIDSISLLDLMINDKIIYRRSMLALASNLRRLGVTSMITVESESIDRGKLEFVPEYFIFDGIIALYQNGEEDKRVLSLEVIKMRGGKHSFMTVPYDIASDGFKIYAQGT